MSRISLWPRANPMLWSSPKGLELDSTITALHSHDGIITATTEHYVWTIRHHFGFIWAWRSHRTTE